MISYPIYKFIHLISLMLFFTTMTVQLFSEPKKLYKILTGVATLFILVSGMGLLARIGISHGQMWPLWAILKVIIWLILGIGLPLIVKRMPDYKPQSFWAMLGIFAFAAYTVLFLR